MSWLCGSKSGPRGQAVEDLIGEAPPSPAGPIERRRGRGLRAAADDPAAAHGPGAALQPAPDRVRLPGPPRARRGLPDARASIGGDPVITSHPDHVRSLFTAKPEQAPSLTGESPLRPIVGPNSVLTAIGPRHMRQRKLLLPPFHGEAIDALRADDRRRRRARDRPLAGRPAVRARAADAGDHARRDHGRDLRDRGTARAAARPSTGCARRSGAWSRPRPGRSPSSPS